MALYLVLEEQSSDAFVLEESALAPGRDLALALAEQGSAKLLGC